MNRISRYAGPILARPHFPSGGFPVVDEDHPLIRGSVPNAGGQIFAWLASVPYNIDPARPSRATNQNAVPTYAAYEMGQALSLNGSNNGLDFGNLASLVSGAGALTFSFWIKVAATTSGRIFGQWNNTGSDQNFLVFGTNSKMEVAFKGTAASIPQVQCNAALTNNKLTHVVIVWNQTTNVTFYYNAAPQTKTNIAGGSGGTMQNSTKAWQIGYETGSSSAPITGLIDNLRVFTRTLNQSEVFQLYADPFIGFKFGRGGVLSSLVGSAAAAAAARNYAVSVIS